MDYINRLDQLDAKLMNEGLTENEMAELALIRSYYLLAVREALERTTKAIDKLSSNLKE